MEIRRPKKKEIENDHDFDCFFGVEIENQIFSAYIIIDE